MRVVLGVAYRGQAYNGWQSQPSGNTVQDRLERALARFAAVPLRTVCAGRTDTGVHALNQVVHLDTEVVRTESSWVRGTNRFLPPDIAVQWCLLKGDEKGDENADGKAAGKANEKATEKATEAFHARFGAVGRRYVYVLLESVVRPAVEAGSVGWSFRPLDGDAMRRAAQTLLGEHDFTSFRSSECQSPTPVKTIRAITITRRGAYWRFEFDANAFLHHMVRNLMGALLAVGSGVRSEHWLDDVLVSRNRALAAPTFPADGLYFVGPYYDAVHAIPQRTAAMDWLP